MPLIPVFMALVGAATSEQTDRQLRTLQRLAGHFLDVVAGLPTLKVFGRAEGPGATIRTTTDATAGRPWPPCEVTFLSSLVLELLATVSVALVAVAVGLRLLGGHLVFAPRCSCWCWPRRPTCRCGSWAPNYHASAEGMSVAEQVFEVLERPAPAAGDTAPTVPDPATSRLVVEDLEVTYPGRDRPALDARLTRRRPRARCWR